MKLLKIFVVILVYCFTIASLNIFTQEEVWVGIKDGMSMVPVALPDFHFTKKSVPDNEIKKELYNTLWSDLSFSRVFKLVPREHYGYIKKFNPSNSSLKMIVSHNGQPPDTRGLTTLRDRCIPIYLLGFIRDSLLTVSA